jgi:hypothetical protein
MIGLKKKLSIFSNWRKQSTSLLPKTAIANHIHMPSELGSEIENGWQDVFWQYDNRYGTAAYQIERYSSKKAAIGDLNLKLNR